MTLYTAKCSELVLLQNFEEVFDLKNSILWHVSAVNGISDSVVAELSPTIFETELENCEYAYLIVSGRKCFAISGS